ncbi:hypothetical protein EVAR_92890_1 [Eumeta japonica]|uniref:Endonuclease-reverse transcriptase n=1 Tax=Eumeta variegata TaxID=151549 RepID=A0A4C1TA49_EUMVA|nr:hypothetical protein EVAR_92890_1 [Eumeta japonica]
MCLEKRLEPDIEKHQTKEQAGFRPAFYGGSILDLKLKDKHRSCDIRHKTKLINAGKHAQQLKWKWAGHMIRTTGERWTKLVTTWKGPKGKRARGRPIDRWTDDLRKVAGDNWTEAAGNRAQWRQLEEAYTRGGP